MAEMTLMIPQEAVRGRLRWLLIGALTLVTLCLVVIVIVSVSSGSSESTDDVLNDPPVSDSVVDGKPQQRISPENIGKFWGNATAPPAARENSSPLPIVTSTTTTPSTTTSTTTRRTTTTSAPSEPHKPSDSTIGELTVLIKEGKFNIRDDLFDPYPDLMVTVVVMNDARHRRSSTSTKDNTRDPVWDETIKFQNVTLTDEICFEVWEKDGISEDDRVGHHCPGKVGDMRSQGRLGRLIEDASLDNELSYTISYVMDWMPYHLH